MSKHSEKQRSLLKRLEENDSTLTSVSLSLSSSPNDLSTLQRLRRSSHIQELNLSMSLADDQVHLIAAALTPITSIQTLCLDLQEVSDSGFARLINLLKDCPSPIKRFELRTNRLSSDGSALIIESLLCHMTINELDLYATELDYYDLVIGDSGVKHIRAALAKRNKPMKYLGIRQHGITDLGVSVLTQGIRDSPGVYSLSLQGNGITQSGASVLARFIKETDTLKSIDLGENGIGDEGAIVLAQALCVNRTVHHVNLKACGVGDGGAMRFAEALYNAPDTRGLQILILDFNNKVGDAAVEMIAQALKTNRTVKVLSVKYCRVGDEGGVQVARSLKENDCLEELHLDGNDVGDATALELAEAIKINRTLRHLHLSNTHIRNQGQDKLIDALKVNNTILSISLTDTSGSRVSEVSAVEGLLMKNRELERVREELEKVKKERDEALNKLELLGQNQ
ncbi:NLR family CARD domain-containing protein 3-like [Corticium candelabrum]|uniref:NLR family CARD domain-containing protein 3-like n=1 Tax=Corticium candelabrum TaxID=121492 RepID=UPI002E26C138|nr:NLR family CARD domain-containing protein 3-like [Corticium candelabrum]